MKPAYVVLVVLFAALTTTLCVAQSHGVPASVTSFGFGGSHNNAPGVPASVTSTGPGGFGFQCCSNHFVPFGTPPHIRPNGSVGRPHDGNFRNNGGFGFFPGYVPIYTSGYYPGYSPVIVAQEEESARAEGDDTEDGVGPTVFDHRGPRRHAAEDAYDRGYEEGRAAAEEARASHEDRAAHKMSDPSPEKRDSKAAEPAAPAIEVKTVLVYKDGHKEEIANYAIVGDQLMDFSTGRRKIAIASLDVAATVKANDERGVDFQLPTMRAKK